MKVLNASQPAVASLVGSVNEANPVNCAGTVKDSAAASCAVSLPSQMSDSASSMVSLLPDSSQHQTRVASTDSSSLSSAQPYCSSLPGVPNHTVPFKVGLMF